MEEGGEDIPGPFDGICGGLGMTAGVFDGKSGVLGAMTGVFATSGVFGAISGVFDATGGFNGPLGRLTMFIFVKIRQYLS